MHFRQYFDAVHPFFWPVPYWQLGHFVKWMCAEKLNAVFFEITRWGGVRVIYEGDRIEAPPYTPFALIKPRWNDPVRASDVPVLLETELSHWHDLVLPRRTGEVSPKVTEGALTAPQCNTS